MTDVLTGRRVDVVSATAPRPTSSIACPPDPPRRRCCSTASSRFSLQIGRQAREAVPGTKVILWPRDEGEMEVLDGASPEPRRVAVSPSRALLNELHGNQGR